LGSPKSKSLNKGIVAINSIFKDLKFSRRILGSFPPFTSLILHLCLHDFPFTSEEIVLNIPSVNLIFMGLLFLIILHINICSLIAFKSIRNIILYKLLVFGFPNITVLEGVMILKIPCFAKNDKRNQIKDNFHFKS